MLKVDDEPKPQERGLTTAERASALATGQAKAVASAAVRHRVEVFVLRASNTSFVWQLRRGGLTIIGQSAATFPSPALARSAGEVALTAFLS